MVMVFATFNAKATALKIGKALLKQKLIASYSLLPIVESAWWWNGKIIDDKGPLLILKTKESNFSKIESYINIHSGYEVPEVIAIKADKVSIPYLNWVNTETH